MNQADNTYKTMVSLFAFLAFCIPAQTFAETTIIENSVYVSASSGGNTAKDGEIIEGTTSADVFMQTIIDGETVELFEQHFDDMSEPFEKEFLYATSGTEVETHIKTFTGTGDDANTADDKKDDKEINTFIKPYTHTKTNIDSSIIGSSTVQKNKEMMSDVDEISYTPFSSSISNFIKHIMSYVLSFFR